MEKRVCEHKIRRREAEADDLKKERNKQEIEEKNGNHVIISDSLDIIA